MGASILLAVAACFFVGGGLIYLVVIYNELVRLRTDTDRAWSNIDVLLKQRHDEIPNLVETCKGYMRYEQSTLERVTQARTAYAGASTIAGKAQADLLATSALQSLFAVAENYPELKANATFLQLQKFIAGLEERIADRREFFNDDVATYNTRIRQIPDVLIASLLHFRPRELFKVSEDDRRALELKLAQAKPGN